MVKYAEHKFYHWNHCEGYSSVAWSAFTLCNHPQNSSYHPRLTLCTSVPISFISLSLQLLVTAVLLSFSMNLTTVDTASKILQYSSFCVQLISLSLMSTSHTYMVACIRIPFPLTLNNVPLYVSITFYSSIIRGWTFWLLWIILLWTWIYKYLFKSLVSTLLGLHLEAELLDQMVVLCAMFEELESHSPLRLYHFTFPSAIHKGPSLVTSLPMMIFYFSGNGHPNGCEVMCHCDCWFPFL